MTKQEATKGTGRKSKRALRLGGFHRVSVVGGRDDKLRSPEFAKAAVDRYVEAEGARLVEWRVSLDSSGSRTDEDVELEALIVKVEAGELDGIVVAKLDRLSRLAPRRRLDLLERIGAERLFSATESNDVSTPEGRMVRELFFLLARMEWEKYANNWTVAKINAIERGVAIARDAAFGYRFDDLHRYVIEPAEAVVVVELFELRAAGGSWSELVEAFERMTGRETSRQTMSALVRSRVYLGEVAYGDELVNVDAHEAIVELDLFEAVQRVNAERAGDPQRKNRGHAGRSFSFLGGVAKCEGCRRAMVYKSRPSQADRYVCNAHSKCPAPASLVAAELDAYVWSELLEWAGESADELVELEAELDARGDRIVAEERLEEARRVAAEYELDVELELEVGRETYAAGRQARRELVERREAELEAIGEATELELVASTLRQAGEDLEDGEKRALLRIALAGGELVIRRASRVPVEERVVALELGGSPAAPAEDALELLEDVAA